MKLHNLTKELKIQSSPNYGASDSFDFKEKYLKLSVLAI